MPLTRNNDCEKIAEGKQTKARDFTGQILVVCPTEVFYKEVEMKELVEIFMWAIVGVFTYIFFIALNHTIWEVLK